MRNLKTNFYTYAGVVKALDGVSFDMWEGETLGLVGETGCGKSVTALSLLRLIPQPPGKIEEGEALFDVPEDDVAKIEELEAQLRGVLPRILGDGPEAQPDDLSPRRLREIWKRVEANAKSSSADMATFRNASVALLKLKEQYDLLSKSEEDMRAVRGNKIAMIFQDPMQALNPVFPIGDQISENILLHQREAVLKAIVEKMELEEERDAIVSALESLDPQGEAIRGRVLVSEARGESADAGSHRPAMQLPLKGSVWAAAFRAAEGDIDRLSDLRDWVAGSGIQERAREALVARLDTLLARASRLLHEEEPISGHFARYLPRKMQLAYYRRLAMSPSEVARQLKAILESSAGSIGLKVDVGSIGWKQEGATTLRVTFPEGTSGAAAAEWIRKAVHEGKARPAIRAIVSVEPGAESQAIVKTSRASKGGPVRWVPIVRKILRRPFREEGIRWAVQMLRRVKISDPHRIAGQYPYELSGGMQQRALIAIALSCNPRLLIADEPTTALDVTIQAQILELIREMKKGFGSSVLIITHDLGIIAEMCNRVCVMYAGHLAEDASVRAVFKAPLHPYTQGLMKAIPSHAVKKDELEIIRGSVPNLIYPPPGCRFHPRCPLVMPTCGWSPAEVADHLKELVQPLASSWGWKFDVASLSWQSLGTSEVRVTFPQGTDVGHAVQWLRTAVNEGRSRPAIRAIVSVEAGEGSQVRVRILEARKPPEFEAEPKHFVTCLLFEEGVETPIAGGASLG